MNFIKKWSLPALVGTLSVLTLLVSCKEEDFTIGDGVTGEEPFTSEKATYDVFARNKGVQAVQTNKLGVYQLGRYNDPVYGTTEAKITSQVQLSSVDPTFGSYTQDTEDDADTDSSVLTIEEEETVTSVYLYIPFLTAAESARDSDLDGVDNAYDDAPDDPTNDSDNDGLTNIEEKSLGTDPLNPDTDGDGVSDADDSDYTANTYPVKFDLDSIYGDRTVPFNLKVEQSTYFLRDYDPETNFEESQAYYSNQTDITDYVGSLLYEGEVTISDTEMIFFNEEDDPDTEEDEREAVDFRLNPGIRVPLNNEFFQQNVIDKEGQPELSSADSFKDFFRGIHLSVDSDLLVLMDLRNANITINYTYKSKNTNGTSDDTSDDTVEDEKGSFVLNLLSTTTNGTTTVITGNAVNTFVNDAYNGEIENSLGSDENASRIYLKGGSGTYSEIDLFEELNGREIINQIKANNWIINEANLVFYVDREAMAANEVEPPRLYLFKTENQLPVYSYTYDATTSQSSYGMYPIYDGKLQTSGGKGEKYKVKITDYINDVIVRDSTNYTLGLTVSSHIGVSSTKKALLNDGSYEKLPNMSATTPLGTVLYGSNINAIDDSKKLKLEIYYTKTE